MSASTLFLYRHVLDDPLPSLKDVVRAVRPEYQEIAENFPALLDALEKYAGAKLDGIDFGAIEWYHRIGNEFTKATPT